jgi:hypothetical protein
MAQRRTYRERSPPQNLIFRSPCNRRGHTYAYQEGTPWNHISSTIDQHERVCPNITSEPMTKGVVRKEVTAPPSATVAPVARMLETQTGRRKGAFHVAGKMKGNHRRGRKAKRAPMVSWKKHTMDEGIRKRSLENDDWSLDVTPTSVKCCACGRTVSLDKRSRYYPGLWLKHRGKCMEIKRLETEVTFPNMSSQSEARID